VGYSLKNETRFFQQEFIALPPILTLMGFSSSLQSQAAHVL